jgi:flagellar basal-body rod modification protein FlgD
MASITGTTSTTTPAADRQAFIDKLNSSSAGQAKDGQLTNKANEQTDRFLKLLVAQMSHQDPLNPLDNAQVTSQMAQISTVEGIGRMNTTLDSLKDQSSGLRAVDAAGLIGKSALIEGDQINLQGGMGKFGLNLDSDANQVQVKILNEAGISVRTVKLSNVSQGVQPMVWDGLDDRGESLPDGKYTFQALANPGAAQSTISTLSAARVNAVVGNQDTLKIDLAGVGLKVERDIKGFI